MALRLVPAHMSFLDANGDPLAGGKLEFFTTGTSNNKNTYSDEALTTPNANPVILDSGGRTTGDIWGSGEFKLVISTSADVAQTPTYDPLIGGTLTDVALLGSANTWTAINTFQEDVIVEDFDVEVTIASPTTATESAHIGIYNQKTFVYRIEAQPENTTKQWFKFTLADIANIAGAVEVVAVCDMTGGLASGYSRALYRIGQVSDAAGPDAHMIFSASQNFCALAQPVVSGDDVLFGGNIPTNATSTTGDIDIYITLYADDFSSFTFTGLSGGTAHTGVFNANAVVSGGDFKPLIDNAHDIGDANNRFTDIYATNATIQTSTIKAKEQVNPLQGELVAALSSVESKTFKMKKDVDGEAAGKGKARSHVGPILEDVHVALQSAGLDPDDYDFLIGDGSFRPTEVLFLMLEDLKARITALEA